MINLNIAGIATTNIENNILPTIFELIPNKEYIMPVNVKAMNPTMPLFPL
jgi:hypothetical protein